MYPLLYAFIPLFFIGILISQINIKKILDALFWVIVIALFLGAYLSVPGHENIYLFRFLLPLHLILWLLSQELAWEQVKKYRIYLIFLFLYLMFSLFSLFWAEDLSLGIRYLYFTGEIIYLFCFCFYHLNSTKKMGQLFQVITVIFSLSLLLGMIEIWTGWHLPLSGSNVYVTRTSEFQPTGFLYNTNDYALLMAMLYPVACQCVLRLKYYYFNIGLYLLFTLGTLFVIVSTYSRIGMLVIGMNIVLMFFYQFRKKSWLILFLSLPMFFSIIVFSPIGKQLTTIAYAAFTDKETSTLARENLYELLMQIIFQSHFMGVGAGNVPQKLNALLIGYTDNNTIEAYTSGHNFWLETLGNIGIIGFLACIGIFTWYIIILFKSGYVKKSSIALLIWVTFISASIALSTILEKRFLWFMLAVGICLIQQASEEGETYEEN